MIPIFESWRQPVKLLFMAVAVAVVLVSLVFSNRLVKQLAKEERSKIEIWAAAMELLPKSGESSDMKLVLQILQSNKTIPVILHDKTAGSFSANNLKIPEGDASGYLLKKTVEFEKKHAPIVLEELNQYLYYDDSYILKRLQLYPYVQLSAIVVFIVLAFTSLVSSQRAQQNKIWAGLSKETAHQLGTPLSALTAWTEYLKLRSFDPVLIAEIDKDVDRLRVIVDRFSKIGSVPETGTAVWQEVVRRSVAYLEKRISGKVELRFKFPESPVVVQLNEPLFSWVVENLTKNAVDAMGGEGVITYTMGERGNYCYLDIDDTGKGIAKSRFNRIFQPGFTTKERGWGLGLSLAKRIVKEYHNGKIFVKQSEIGKGTTFRILLRRRW
ncbi:sensor histidine kinase [Petrimonas mucosa]|jgi:two-component system, sporulation sensor kinase D|uniref:histidine kinase n=1 Tax=Petrimonas mucosa TaxID=1642646 RepID=A0A1G4G628_9BACT|nr:HAMP domain-containing sensor histidine kinase [Petrimonas mucosa]MDD3560271.1 HAMP domain-containing sensor histidine kinase [Petrimonas mucosa]SCM56831.1 Sensor protein ZraS [Petrimonas mucosa]SFU38275.1 Signal transduction histidine kinase [Porphyromonadaceae bacterium KHP3R9]